MTQSEWLINSPITLISQCRPIFQTNPEGAEEIAQAFDKLWELARFLTETGVHPCHLNFKFPLHKLNAYLECTTISHKKQIHVIRIVHL
jgi:hypothetical protein